MPGEPTIRDATPADAAAIADVLNAHSVALFGESDLTAATVEGWFRLPRVVWFGLAERDGRAVGYADVQQGDERADVDARVVDGGAAAPLVAAAVEHARTGLPVRGYAPATDEPVVAAYREAGFEPIRHSFTMEISLDDGIEPAEWPEGIEPRPWGEGDDPVFHSVLMDAFSEHFAHERRSLDDWLHVLESMPETDRSLWTLALADGQPAGATICAFHASGDPTLGWVHELGVLAPWRRRGLGLALLRHAFAELGRRGATRVGLGVDAENTTGAVRLYERAGMHVTRRYDTWELRR